MNLLKETKELLQRYNVDENDIEQIQLKDCTCTWDEFKQLAVDVDYNNGYGKIYINQDLTIIGSDWWISRREYDGAEYWWFNKKPKLIVESENKKITSLYER